MTATPKLKSLLVPLDPTIVERIDAHAERLRAATPGVRVTRLDAVRSLVLGALATSEAATAVRS